MPITPATYARRPYVRSGSMADLLQMQGRQQGEAHLRSGDISAQMWANLGTGIQNAITGYAREKQEAPLRAQAAEARALDVEARRTAVEQGQRLSRQDTAFMALLEQQPNPDPREVMSIYGPQRGMQIAQGISAFGELQSGKVKDARENAGRLAIGLKAVSPPLQAQMWPAVRAAAIQGGLGDVETVPEQLTPDFLDGVIGWATGQQPAEAPSLIQRDPTRDLVDPKTGRVVTPGTPAAPEVKRHKVTVDDGRGNPVDKLVTEEELAQGVQAYRAPTSGRAEPSRFWVMRNGAAIRVTEDEYRQGDTPASTREQGRPVTSGDAGDLAELDSSLDDLNTLGRDMGTTGAASWAESKIPDVITSWTGWGADAKSRQGTIDRVKQVIGKALEGGVLRKEDEVKYEKILPKLADAPSVAATKLQGLWRAIEKKKQTRIDALADAGYDTSRFAARPKRERDSQTPAVDSTVTYQGKLYRVKSITNGEAELEPIP